MPKIFPVFNNFTSGKLSPLVQARVDTKAYANGLRQCENFIILPHGGIVRRGGFEKIYQANTDTGPAGYLTTASRLIPFMFSTSPQNSYILEFDGATGAEKIRVFKSSGTFITGATMDASAWFNAEDVMNIRYAQSADVVYFVDGAHTIHKITRSGTVASPSFALTESVAVGSPYANVIRRELKIYRTTYNTWWSITGSTGKYLGGSGQFSRLFSVSEAGVYLEKTLDLADETYGIIFGEDISNSDNYNNEADTIDLIAPAGSQLRKDLTTESTSGTFPQYSFEITSTIYIPEAENYSFGLNLNDMGDVLVDEKKVVSFYDKSASYTKIIYAKGTAYEYRTNSASELLSVGSHVLTARFTHFSNPDWNPAYWGIDIGWRKGTSVKTTGNTGSGVMTVDYTNIDSNGQWCGNKVFDVIVKISPGGTLFGWTYRRNTNHPVDETTDWPNDSQPDTDPGADDPGGWCKCPVDTNTPPEEIGQPLPATAYGLNVTGLNLGKITITGTPAGGDIFTFKIGYQPIPASQFRITPVSGETLYPSVITFHQNRMWLGFNGIPLIRASKTGDYENFERGANANDALEFVIASGRIDTIRWMKSGRKLLIGTAGCEYVFNSSGGVITPDSSPDCVPNTFWGSKFIEPIQIEDSVIFIEKNGIRLRDNYYRYDRDGYFSDDQSILSYEEIKDGIKEFVFQQAGLVGYLGNWSGITIPPINLIWIVTDQNELKSITFEKNHNVIAWHEHDIDGDVHSIAVIPGADGVDALWALVKRATHRWIERLGKTIKDDCYHATDHTDQKEFNSTAELLPVLFDKDGQTIQDYRKRFVNISAKIYTGKRIFVAEGSEDFSSESQMFDTVSISGPETVHVSGTGWGDEITLVVKSLAFGTALSGSSIAYPAAIMDIHGTMIANAP